MGSFREFFLSLKKILSFQVLLDDEDTGLKNSSVLFWKSYEQSCLTGKAEDTNHMGRRRPNYQQQTCGGKCFYMNKWRKRNENWGKWKRMNNRWRLMVNVFLWISEENWTETEENEKEEEEE